MTNPFEQNVPQQQAQPENPFGQAGPAQQQAAPPSAQNPFGQNVPTQAQQQAPATPQYANPYAQPQQQAPAAPQAYMPPPTPAQYANPYVQQQAPQAYAPPAAQAPAAQQYPAGYPVPQHDATPPALGQLSAAGVAPAGDGRGAKLANMYGRLVIMFPLILETKAKNPRFVSPEDQAAGRVTEDRVTTTVVVLDDGRGGMTQISWGGSAMPPVADTDSAPLPYVRKAMWISQSRIVTQLKPHLPAGPGAAPGMVIGRVLKAGNEHNSPWYLSSDVSESDLGLGNAYLDLVRQGRYPHPLAP